MATQSDKKLPHIYFENLDALRFLAAFSVIVFHYFADLKALFPSLLKSDIFKKVQVIADKGSLGVNFFFVLSGFLITYLILHERKHKGSFSLKKFLIRRTLRIWPLYFIIILTGFVLFPAIIPSYSTAHNPWMYTLFLANFDELNNGLNDSVNFLTSPWSVAVEEQFYLFWGIALFLLYKIKKFNILYLIGGLYLLSFVFRWYYVDEERIIYYHTFAVCQDILTGTFIGVTLFQGRKWLDKLKSIKKIWVVLLYLLGLAMCIGKNKIFAGDLLIVERFCLSLFFGFVLLDQIRGDHSFFKFGKIKVFNYLGKISYGLYMYHLVVMYLLVLYIDSWHWNSYHLIWIYGTMSLAGVVLLAALSYRFIESPLLKMKPK